MTTDRRDGIALYLIAALAVLVTCFIDVDMGRLFEAVLVRF